MPSQVEIERLLIRLMGDTTDYIKKLGDAERKTKTTVQRITASLDRVGMKMSTMGSAMTMRLTAPIVAFGVASVKSFMDFDRAMIESLSIMKATESQQIRMSDLATELSGKSVHAATDVARAYYYLASAGLDAEASLAAMVPLTKFATAGMFDLATATDLLTDAQSALGLTVKGNAKVNQENMMLLGDKLVKASVLANASTREFSESLTNTGAASLKSFGKGASEGIALLTAFADQGAKGAVAGTYLTRFYNVMAKSALSNAEAHELLGFKVFDSAGKMRKTADIVENLENIMSGMDDETKAITMDMLGFDVRLQSVIKMLMGSSDAIRENRKELDKAGGTVEEVSEKQLKSFWAQLTIAKNQVWNLAKEVGSHLAPKLIQLSEWIKGLIEKWKAMSDAEKDNVIKIVMWVAAAGPMLTISGKLLLTLSSLIKVLGAMKVGMLSIIPLFGKAVKGIAAFNFGMTASAAASTKWTLAMIGTKAGILGLVAVATYAIAKLLKLDKAAGYVWEQYSKRWGKLKELNDQRAGQTQHMNKMAVERGFKSLEHMRSAPKEEYDKIVEAYRKNQGTADKAKEAGDKAKGARDEAKGGKNPLTKADIERMKQQLAAKKKIESVTEALKKQVDVFGMSNIEIQRWELKMIGATDAMLAEFDRAAAQLKQKEEQKKALDAAKDQNQTQSNLGIASVRAAAGSGSAEAATRIDEYMFRIRQGENTKSPEVKHLASIDKNMQILADRTSTPDTDAEYQKYVEHTETNRINQ